MDERVNDHFCGAGDDSPRNNVCVLAGQVLVVDSRDVTAPRAPWLISSIFTVSTDEPDKADCNCVSKFVFVYYVSQLNTDGE